MTESPAREPPSAFRIPAPLAGVCLVLAVLFTYLAALTGGAFHYDDGHHVVGNPAVHAGPAVGPELPADAPLAERARRPGAAGLLARCERFFVDSQTFSSNPGTRMYRPVLMVTYALDSALHGARDPRWWLLTNLMIHALVAVLVAGLARRLGLSPLAATFAGAVMALHPVFSEALNYVSSRSESVAALWMLIALHLHLAGRDRGGAARAGFVVAALLASCCATLAKETTALFFVAVGWMELVRRRDDLRGGLVRGVVYGAIYSSWFLVLWFLLRPRMLDEHTSMITSRLVHVAAGADPETGGGRSILGNLMLQMRVVVLYLQLLVRPVGLSIEHGVDARDGHTLAAVVALLIHAGIAGAAVLAFLRKGVRLPLLCVGWFWIFLAPSIVVPLNVVMNEHRLYLPGIAVSLLAGAALARVADLLAARGVAPLRAALIAGAPLLLFVPLDVYRSRQWTDDETLWRAAVALYPDSARAQMHLGAALHEQAQVLPPERQLPLVDEALDHYLESERLHPTWLNLQLDLGNLWLQRARLSGADSDYRHAIDAFDAMGHIAGEQTPRWRMHKAAALMVWKHYDEAAVLVRRLDVEDDSVTPIYDELMAEILRGQGDGAGARAAQRRAIEVSRPEERVRRLLTLGWWDVEDAIDGRRSGTLGPAEQRALLDSGQKIIGEAHDLGVKVGDYLPKLYIARFLHFLGQPGGDEFREGAIKMGWTRGVSEEIAARDLAWTKGARTPNVVVGTFGAGRIVPARE